MTSDVDKTHRKVAYAKLAKVTCALDKVIRLVIKDAKSLDSCVQGRRLGGHLGIFPSGPMGAHSEGSFFLVLEREKLKTFGSR